MGNYFIDFQAREGCIGLKSNVQGESVLKQEVGGLIVQTWQQKLPQWNPRETDFIVNQELRDINKKGKSKGSQYWEITVGLYRRANPAGTPLSLQPSCSVS